MQSHSPSFQCPATTPGYLAYEFRLRHYDDLLHDPSDAGRIIDGAGDLIVRATSGSGREGSWFQYHPRSNQGASAFALHADGHVAGRVALSERFEKSLVVGRLSPHLSEPEWTRTSRMPPNISDFEYCFEFCAEFLRSDQNCNTKCQPPSVTLCSILPVALASPPLRICVTCNLVTPSLAADSNLPLRFRHLSCRVRGSHSSHDQKQQHVA